MSEQQTQEKMVPMSAIEQACREVLLDKTTSTVANELHGNMPGIAYYAIWRRCHAAAIPVVTTERMEQVLDAGMYLLVAGQYGSRLTAEQANDLKQHILGRLNAGEGA